MTSKTSKKRAESNWVKTRRALVRVVKREVSKRLGEQQQDITEFTVRYEKELRKPWKASSQDELIQHIEASDLVYGGDFHALEQAQRTHLRLLRRIDKPVVLALECFQSVAQKHLDAFCEGTLSLDQLREKSKWDQVWGFSWEHYKPLFELALARGFRLVALNSKSRDPLEKREQNAAKIIAREWGESHVTYVLFGDLHLAPEHLPAKVLKALKRSKPRDLTVHLNSERVYFQLANRGLETKVDVVKFNARMFCVLSTPPWIKWQSYLLFLDRMVSQDDGERIDSESDFDPTDQVALLVRLAADDLGVARKFKQINDLAVYGENDETIWREVAKRASAQGERETAESMLRAGQRFFIPHGGIAYQPKATINSAASLAGLYLHARLSGRKKSLWNFPVDMRAQVWIEAVSYFISKTINHSRRSETIAGLQTKARSSNAEALRLALDVRLSEMVRLQSGRKRPLQIQPRRRSSYVEASRILGGMLGERLYLAYRSRKLKTETVVSWLTRDPGTRAFLDSYDGIVEKIANVGD